MDPWWCALIRALRGIRALRTYWGGSKVLDRAHASPQHSPKPTRPNHAEIGSVLSPPLPCPFGPGATLGLCILRAAAPPHPTPTLGCRHLSPPPPTRALPASPPLQRGVWHQPGSALHAGLCLICIHCPPSRPFLYWTFSFCNFLSCPAFSQGGDTIVQPTSKKF